jgi:hypothetical protein
MSRQVEESKAERQVEESVMDLVRKNSGVSARARLSPQLSGADDRCRALTCCCTALRPGCPSNSNSVGRHGTHSKRAPP